VPPSLSVSTRGPVECISSEFGVSTDRSIRPLLNPHPLWRPTLAIPAPEPLAEWPGACAARDALPADELVDGKLDDSPTVAFDVDALAGRQIEKQRIGTVAHGLTHLAWSEAGQVAV
jgi:hypothetical protein